MITQTNFALSTCSRSLSSMVIGGKIIGSSENDISLCGFLRH